MATLSPLRVVDGSAQGSSLAWWDRGASTWSTTFSGVADSANRVNEPVTTTPANGDTGIGLTTAGNASLAQTMELDDTPADFVSMDTLSIRYSTAQVGTYSDDTARIFLWVRNAANSLTLAGFDGATQQNLDFFNGSNWAATTFGGSGTAPAYDKLLSFVYVNTTATKADWDGARVAINFLDTRNMGSDAAAIVLVDFQLEGTYTALSLPYSGIQVTRPAVNRAANW